MSDAEEFHGFESEIGENQVLNGDNIENDAGCVPSSNNTEQVFHDCETESESGSDEENDDDGHLKLDPEELKKFQKQIKRTGVVYLSRIPPFMKPQKLKNLLSEYGEIGRVYLVPEDSSITNKRKRFKNNKRKNYIEGWVEFLDKRVAKRTVEYLNNTKIGGKKRSFYYDDIWTLKYLPKFKWQNLTEQLAYEKVKKENLLRMQMMQAKREASQFMQQVEIAKSIEKIKEKRKLRGEEDKTTSRGFMRQRKRKEELEQESTESAQKILQK
ncbi:hypothetical protein ROZALSC1DRAFT_29391, partial [Rozella allomycis CSF55]